ncbi:uncharacterized protein PHALS_15274 [Plasmopara halstedii]|uniref:Uncharacterized protein n=1 Tax=Plasmopara halstedii TaxID=4781 RepID=A0A0P1B7B2_PLAHL|nr:uncharacterized protein PHALS_15274 [Plasmopara halstedii]CEG50364.1 hypothetical protein PHALS_15274 [Plasmopara halstedii]|eukprot:XP_024586733.1 hypothetical protein PHALS_15274 [Plasmopara halstedii]
MNSISLRITRNDKQHRLIEMKLDVKLDLNSRPCTKEIFFIVRQARRSGIKVEADLKKHAVVHHESNVAQL